MYGASALLAVAMLTLAACKAPSAHPVQLHDLHDLGDLRAAVNRDTSTPRIVLLLSPTYPFVMPAPGGCGLKFWRSIPKRRFRSKRFGFVICGRMPAFYGLRVHLMIPGW